MRHPTGFVLEGHIWSPYITLVHYHFPFHSLLLCPSMPFALQCSATCGSGVQKRDVYCPQVHQCDLVEKPLTHRPCKEASCIVWVAGSWSEVRVVNGTVRHQIPEPYKFRVTTTSL
jgi:hypothetical protein